MARWRQGFVVLAAGAVLLAAGGCGSEADDAGGAEGSSTTAASTTVPAAAHRVAVDPASLKAPGTEIADGIEVQEGSSLVASAFPVFADDGDAAPGAAINGWTALLVVDGDPIEVWDRYAEALGIDDVADAVHACVVTTPDDMIPEPGRPAGSTNTIRDTSLTRFLTEPVVGGEDLVECSATVGATTARLVVGAQGCGAGQPAPEVDCGALGAAHLWVLVDRAGDRSYQELGTQEAAYERASPAEGVDPAGEVDSEPWPDGPIIPAAIGPGPFGPALAAAGEQWDAGLDNYLSATTEISRVPAGGRQLVPPAILTACSGAVTILDLPGKPTEAVALLDAADPDGDDPIRLEQGTDFGGRAWAGGEIATAGGYYVMQRAVDAGGGRSWVFVSECGD